MADIRPDTIKRGPGQAQTDTEGVGFLESVADTAGKTGDMLAGAARTGGNALIDAAEGLMDAHPLARFAGTLVGLESPAMRREDLALERGKFELARERAYFEEHQAMRPMREQQNRLMLQSLYEQQYRATVDPIAERISRGVAKQYGQLQMSPKAWNQWKESQSYKDLVATQTAFGMLKDNNPAVVRAGVEYARRLGVNISQRDGKTYFDAPSFGVRGELTPETEKQFIELGEKLAMQDAAAFEKMEQRNKRIDGYVMNKTVNNLIAKTGMSHGEAYQISEIVFSQFPPQDRLYYCGLSGARELMQGGLLPEERQEFEMQLDFIRKAYDITVAQDEKGNLFIEGKPAVEWLDRQLEVNPVARAVREMEDAQIARTKLQLEARAARTTRAAQTNSIPAEAAPLTVEDQEMASASQFAREVAEANGIPDWGKETADRFNRGKDEKDQITPEYALEVLGLAEMAYENEMAISDDPDIAYKAVKRVFKEHELPESNIPDFFKKAGEDISYERAEAEYKSAREAADKLPPRSKEDKIQDAKNRMRREWSDIWGGGSIGIPGGPSNFFALHKADATASQEPPEYKRLENARYHYKNARDRKKRREAEEAQARAAQEKSQKKREELRRRLMNKKK